MSVPGQEPRHLAVAVCQRGDGDGGGRAHQPVHHLHRVICNTVYRVICNTISCLQGDHITADLSPVSTVALGHCLHGHHLGEVGGVERLPVGRHPAPPALLAVELQTILQYFSFYTTKSMMWRPAISRVMKNIFHPDNGKYLNSLPLGTYRRGVCRESRRKHSAAYSGTPLRGRPLPARTPR